MSEAPVQTSSTRANVTLELEDGKTVHIVGTAHVSPESVAEVQEVIHAVKPDTVCVELDPMRYEALTDETRWRKLDIFQVIKQRKVLFPDGQLGAAIVSAPSRRPDGRAPRRRAVGGV